MDHLLNRSLGRLMAEDGLLPLPRTVDLVEQIADALREARAQGIVLPDLHPDVILVAEEWQRPPKVTGFGKPEELLASGAIGGGISRYMAPEEQVGGTTDADERADQFSLAAIAYEMLTGCSPFTEDDLEERRDLAARRAQGAADADDDRTRWPPPPVADLVVGLPPGLDDVFRRAMSFEPSERFPHVEEFTAALRQIAEKRPADEAAPTALPAELQVTPPPDPGKEPGTGPITAKVPIRRQAGGLAGWMRGLTSRDRPQPIDGAADGRLPPPMVAPAGAEAVEVRAPLLPSEVVTLISRRRHAPRIALAAVALAIGAGALVAGSYHRGAKVPADYVSASAPPAPAAARAAEEPPAVAPPAPAPEPPAPAPGPAVASAAAGEGHAVVGKHRRHIRRARHRRAAH